MPRTGGQRAAARQADISLAAEANVESNRSMIDLEFVRGLIEAVDNSGIDSLELNRAGTKIKISKTPPAAAVMAGPAPTYAPAAPAPAPAAPSVPAAPAPTPAPAP